MSLQSIEGRIEGLPVEAQEVIRDIVRELNELTRIIGRGAGTPEGRIVGYKGYLWQRTDGGSKTCVYVFEGTNGANTGWQQLRT